MTSNPTHNGVIIVGAFMPLLYDFQRFNGLRREISKINKRKRGRDREGQRGLARAREMERKETNKSVRDTSGKKRNNKTRIERSRAPSAEKSRAFMWSEGQQSLANPHNT